MTNHQAISTRSYGHLKRSNQDPNGNPQPGRKQYWNAMMPIFVAALLGLTLSGCDTLGDLFRINSDAQAQEETTRNRVKTCVIRTDSFRIQVEEDANTTPTVTLSDGVTRYTMQSSGDVFFDVSSEDDCGVTKLEMGDQIIERPRQSGNETVITIIRVD